MVPNRPLAISTCNDKDAELWNRDTGELVTAIELKRFIGEEQEMISYSDVSSDGRWLILHSFGSQLLYDLEARHSARRFHGGFLMSFSPDGGYLGLALDSFAGTNLGLFNLKSQQWTPVFKDYKGHIVQWSPSGSRIIVDRSFDEVQVERAILWDLEIGQQIAEFKTESDWCFDFVSTCRKNLEYFRFDPTEKILTVFRNERVKFYSTDDGTIIKEIEGIGTPFLWSHSGEQFLATDRKRRLVTLWRIR